MKPDPFATLMEIVRALDAAGIHFEMAHNRHDAVSIRASVPGERWEIDVLEDGDVDLERFVSNGHVGGADEMTDFIARFAEPADEASA